MSLRRNLEKLKAEKSKISLFFMILLSLLMFSVYLTTNKIIYYHFGCPETKMDITFTSMTSSCALDDYYPSEIMILTLMINKILFILVNVTILFYFMYDTVMRILDAK